MRRAKVGAGVLVLAGWLGALGLWGCAKGSPAEGAGGQAAAAQQPDQERVVRTVLVVPATAQVAVRDVDVVGTVEGEVTVRVYAKVAERIVELKVQAGQRVAAGDVVATLEATAGSPEAVQQAREGLAAARAQRESLRLQLARQRRLLEGGIAPEGAIETLTYQLQAAEAQVRQLEAGLRQAAARDDLRVVTASVDGIVGQVFYDPGDQVGPQQPLCTIVQMERVKLKAQLPELDYPLVQEGQLAEVQADAAPGPPLKGVVHLKGPIVDPLTRTAELEVLVDNPELRLRPGMMASAAIRVSEEPDALFVLGSQVILTGAEQDDMPLGYVFVVQPDRKVRRVTVRVGPRQGALLRVWGELQPGDAVVAEGQHLLADGDLVNLKAAGPAEPMAPPSPAAEAPAAPAPAPPSGEAAEPAPPAPAKAAADGGQP